MFRYENEKRSPYPESCASHSTMTTDYSRSSNHSRVDPRISRQSLERPAAARRPLPPRPVLCEKIPEKTSVPLKVWIIASASCFAVCAALVLATIVITRWGTADTFTSRELYTETLEPVRSPQISPKVPAHKLIEVTTDNIADMDNDIDNDIQFLEKLPMFKNIVNGREHKSLISKPQIHPLHEDIVHVDRNIKKKDKADNEIENYVHLEGTVPNFKPTLPDFVETNEFGMLPIGYMDGAKDDYFYNDENLYDDYMESNSMINYLIEKVQELHDWIVTDSDLNNDKVSKDGNSTEFGEVLGALNASLSEGNVSIIMNKLKDIYFGENYTIINSNNKGIVTNRTDLVSFGILTLDVMLLHNIQLMAWENQEGARIKMLKDPDVFAFNALFLEPSKVEAKQIEVQNDESIFLKRLSPHQNMVDDIDIGNNFLENILEIGMSTARAAIHLGRAFKNTRNIMTQLSNKEYLSTNIQNQISRNVDGNTHALNHLQTSFDSSGADSTNATFYTELDCVWLLYCRNLVSTSKLNPPYGTMARINGVALRMLVGELSANKALDTMLYELLTGWTELRCNDMFPRCSKVNAATLVIDSILQPYRKSQTTNRGR